ncbi:MAG: hypothetical protein UU09_C0008G0009 [Microgenomates group bacterium GW2011_GWA2_40_6]|nr:MAG: hypothetical protein UU09_C0008G0009 [Microgenomates group bacterium GW2011_GWA2_40_6]
MVQKPTGFGLGDMTLYDRVLEFRQEYQKVLKTNPEWVKTEKLPPEVVGPMRERFGIQDITEEENQRIREMDAKNALVAMAKELNQQVANIQAEVKGRLKRQGKEGK